MSAVLCHNSRYEEIIAAYRDIPYLLESESWEEFVARRGVVEQESLFAITLRTTPEADSYVGAVASMSKASKYVFFGLLTRKRPDGRLGRFCFGRESKEFGGSETRKGVSIFTQDGFNAGFLKVPKDKVHILEHGIAPSGFYKVTGLYTKPDLVMRMLARWIEDVLNETPVYMDEVTGARLAKIRRHLKDLVLASRAGKKMKQNKELSYALDALDARINMRLRCVVGNGLKLSEQLRENRREAKNLQS